MPITITYTQLTPQEMREWRTHLGLSRSSLATKLGVHERTIAYWETVRPPKDIIERMKAL